MAIADTAETDEAAASEVIFSIGSNCGCRYENVKKGIIWLSGLLTDFRCSTIYATPDCHGGSKEYLNAVARGLTSLPPDRLESICKKYEEANGRDDISRKMGNVPIDIDLVVYGNSILRTKDYKCEFFRIGYCMI